MIKVDRVKQNRAIRRSQCPEECTRIAAAYIEQDCLAGSAIEAVNIDRAGGFDIAGTGRGDAVRDRRADADGKFLRNVGCIKGLEAVGSSGGEVITAHDQGIGTRLRQKELPVPVNAIVQHTAIGGLNSPQKNRILSGQHIEDQFAASIGMEGVDILCAGGFQIASTRCRNAIADSIPDIDGELLRDNRCIERLEAVGAGRGEVVTAHAQRIGTRLGQDELPVPVNAIVQHAAIGGLKLPQKLSIGPGQHIEDQFAASIGMEGVDILCAGGFQITSTRCGNTIAHCVANIDRELLRRWHVNHSK